MVLKPCFYITHGKQQFDNYTNEYVETYQNDKYNTQTGGYGILKYNNGETEIHYDKFENGKPSEGYSVIISNNDGVVVYCQNKNRQETYEAYDFDGNKIDLDEEF